MAFVAKDDSPQGKAHRQRETLRQRNDFNAKKFLGRQWELVQCSYAPHDKSIPQNDEWKSMCRIQERLQGHISNAKKAQKALSKLPDLSGPERKKRCDTEKKIYDALVAVVNDFPHLSKDFARPVAPKAKATEHTSLSTSDKAAVSSEALFGAEGDDHAVEGGGSVRGKKRTAEVEVKQEVIDVDDNHISGAADDSHAAEGEGSVRGKKRMRTDDMVAKTKNTDTEAGLLLLLEENDLRGALRAFPIKKKLLALQHKPDFQLQYDEIRLQQELKVVQLKMKMAKAKVESKSMGC